MTKPTKRLKGQQLPVVYRQHTRAYQAHELLIQGFTVAKIAEILHTDDSTVRNMLSTGMKQMTDKMQDMRETWETLTLHRTEWLFSLVAPTLASQVDENPAAGPNPALLKVALDIMRFQKDVLAINTKKDLDGKTTNNNLTINQTIVGSSDLYKEALADAQTDFLGYHEVKNLPSEELFNPSENLIKLEEMATKYLPDQLIFEESFDDADT